MFFKDKNLDLIVSVVLIVAAVNWGSVAYFNTDLVQTLFMSPDLEKAIKGLVGLVGLLALYGLLMKMM